MPATSSRRWILPLGLLLTGQTLVLLILAGWLWTRPGSTQATESQAMLRQVQQLRELTTVRYTIQKVVGVEEQKVPVGSESILLIVQGHVEAGIDLAALGPDDLRVEGQTVRVRLPQARVQRAYLDENETRVWDRRVTWWTPWVPYSKDLEQRARRKALEDIQQQARAMGLLREARRNAEQAVRALLLGLGFQEVAFYPAGS